MRDERGYCRRSDRHCYDRRYQVRYCGPRQRRRHRVCRRAAIFDECQQFGPRRPRIQRQPNRRLGGERGGQNSEAHQQHLVRRPVELFAAGDNSTLRHFDLRVLPRSDRRRDVDRHRHRSLRLIHVAFDHRIHRLAIERQQRIEIERKSLVELHHLRLETGMNLLGMQRHATGVAARMHGRNDGRLPIGHQHVRRIEFAEIASLAQIGEQQRRVFPRQQPSLNPLRLHRQCVHHFREFLRANLGWPGSRHGC